MSIVHDFWYDNILHIIINSPASSVSSFHHKILLSMSFAFFLPLYELLRTLMQHATHLQDTSPDQFSTHTLLIISGKSCLSTQIGISRHKKPTANWKFLSHTQRMHRNTNKKIRSSINWTQITTNVGKRCYNMAYRIYNMRREYYEYYTRLYYIITTNITTKQMI